MTRLIAILAAGLLALLAGPAARAANPALSLEANQAFLKAYALKPGVLVRPNGLMIRTIRHGNGAHPGPQDRVEVYYRGSLIDGHVFDSGPEPDTSPVTMDMGKDNLIRGWIEGLQFMRVGDHSEIVVPSSLGYGVTGDASGTIPPNQTLIFDIELISAMPPPPKRPGQDDDSQ